MFVNTVRILSAASSLSLAERDHFRNTVAFVYEREDEMEFELERLRRTLPLFSLSLSVSYYLGFCLSFPSFSPFLTQMDGAVCVASRLRIGQDVFRQII